MPGEIERLGSLVRAFFFLEVRLEIDEALLRFKQQKSGAATRGIEWRLTFQQWLEWWGKDLDKRVAGHDKLMMCRFADRGPYATGNIYKGYPLDNMRTAGNMKRLRNGLRAHVENEAAKNALPLTGSKDLRGLSEDDWELYRMFQPRSSRRMCCAG